MLWAVSLFFFAPIAWIVASLLQDARTRSWRCRRRSPSPPGLDNYRTLFAQAGIVEQVANSVFLSLGAVVLAVTVSFLIAFCFSR